MTAVENFRQPSCNVANQFDLEITEEFSAIADTWRDFQALAITTAFQEYSWQSSWHKTAENSDIAKPLIVSGYQDGELAFIMPFALERRWGGTSLVWHGHQLSDYNCPLVKPGLLERMTVDDITAIVAGLHLLRPSFDSVYFAKQPAHICGVANPFAHYNSRPFTCSAHFANLQGDWKTFSLAHRSGRSLRRMREKGKKLARLGPTEFVTYTTVSQRQAALSLLIEWKSGQLAARGDRNPFDSRRIMRFLEQLIGDADSAGKIRLDGLECDGKPVALTMGLVSQDRLIYFQAAYDNGEAAKFSPGVLLLQHLLESAIDEGLGVFDFSNGDEDYKAHWIDGSDELYSSFASFTPQGHLIAALDRLELASIREIKKHNGLKRAAVFTLNNAKRLKQRYSG